MLIRTIKPEDFEPIAALTNHYITTTPIHFSYDPVTADELRTLWLKKRDTYPWLVAELDGSLSGYAKAGVWRERTAYTWTPEVGIYVCPRSHRRGIGRTLYTALLDTLRAQGFHSAIGGITIPNDPSIRLHESLGFVHVGTVKRAGWKFDQWHSAGFWQIELVPPSNRALPIKPPPPVHIEC